MCSSLKTGMYAQTITSMLYQGSSNTHYSRVNYCMVDYRGICKWWAEYLESMGEWEQAMQCYDKAQDYYSLVRILCFNGQLDRAAEIAEESGCKVASYHLARRLNVANQV